ncbi:hypothetical protein [Rheinheimera salexigens]|uniref:Lipoprotein n=1 Tax=Rheinheimera salexigens TaxID=1628148 RepID=A0A1E7Q2K5_9GAMM|nr:hypothetical protein [Rheinheimera salexigens]OEY68444.1 hypothetical protein BI198_01820 [Rheinheimera salexigens]
MRVFTFLITILLTACANNVAFNTEQLTALYVADFNSDEITRCTPSDVDLSNREALAFFKQAKLIDSNTLHDYYDYAPCAIEGPVQYQQANCNWQIRAGATGHIQCAEQRWYFACDSQTCEALF